MYCYLVRKLLSDCTGWFVILKKKNLLGSNLSYKFRTKYADMHEHFFLRRLKYLCNYFPSN